MKKPNQRTPDHGNDLLKRELEKGLASGISKRTPAQIGVDFHVTRLDV